MRKIYVLFWCIFFTGTIQAQQAAVRARIVDARGGQPLPYATVKFQNLDGGILSDSLGCFQAALPPGEEALLVQISLVGYEPLSISLQAAAQPVDIRLQPAEALLREVVVSGTLKEVSRDASPVPVEVFTPRFFAKNPTPSLFDALQIVNGVQPQVSCNVCNAGDIHINGLEGPYTMVTIDGMPIVSALSTVYGLFGIPNSMVERVEIVKGPASTLYGSEAVGGLINVITKRPENAPRFSLDLNGSSYQEYLADLAASFRAGRFTGMLSANGFWYNTRHDINDDGFTDVTLQKRLSVFNKWSMQRPDNRVADLALRYVWEDRFGGQLGWTPAWRGSDSIYGESIRTNRFEALGRYRLPGRENLLLSFSFNRHQQDSYYGDTRYDAVQQIGFAQLTWDKTLGRGHDLLAGLSLRHTWLDDNTPVTAAPEGANRPNTTNLPGIFVQDHWTITSRHALLGGLRLDYHPAHGAVWSPRLNWKWSLDDVNTLRLGAGNGFRVANVFSEDHAALTGARTVVLARDLAPERSWNANLNYTTKLFPGFGFVGIDASAFYTYFTNRILADYDTDPDLVIFDNLNGYGVSSGLTLNTDWNFTNGLKIIAGGTLQDVFIRENGRRQPQYHAAPFMCTWALSYTLRRWNLSVDYTGNLYSPMPLPVLPNDYRPDRSPWFSLQNVQVTKKFKTGLELYGGVKNLLNFLPRDPLMRPFDPFDKTAGDPVSNPNGYTFDAAYNYAPLQARRVFVGVRRSW